MPARNSLPLLGLIAGMIAAPPWIAASPAQAQQNIAGLRPHERPAAAPKTTTLVRDPRWLAGATEGIVEPVPPSLKFLQDQGDWYTPFIRPGMPGPYDIRGLHKTPTTPVAPQPKR